MEWKIEVKQVYMGVPKKSIILNCLNIVRKIIKKGSRILGKKPNEMINKYSIGYTTEGEYRGRIIVPSFDENEEINYFVSRSYVGHKNKYKNPEAEKDKIIFNEHLINWEKNIYLVEGVFDMFFLDNAIPVLGKTVSDKLWGKLYENCKKNIIICLNNNA